MALSGPYPARATGLGDMAAITQIKVGRPKWSSQTPRHSAVARDRSLNTLRPPPVLFHPNRAHYGIQSA